MTVVAAVIAVVAAGCGGGINHQQYVQRADGICTATLRAVRSLTAPAPSGTPAARDRALAAYLDRLVPLLHRELGQLRALPRPSQRAAQTRALNAYLAALTQSVKVFGTLRTAAHAGDPGAVDLLQSELAGDRAPALAASAGLSGCSSSAATYR